MPIPISISELVTGKSIEWERLEFKEGWNPEKIIHTLCAFANDINNLGGGYIIIGIAEKNGQPVMPPKGLNVNQVDAIQKKLVELCNKIVPHYFPVVFPEKLQRKNILILWCPGGDARPYKAPVTLGKKAQYAYYVRRFSTTVKADNATENQLIQLAAKIPFDDRINPNAQLSDLDLGHIRTFLQETGSDLFKTAPVIPFESLCRQMQIARGAEEHLRPLNAGLLLFGKDPQKFFRGAC